MIKAKYTIVLKTLLDDVEVKPLIDKAMSTYPMYKPINDFKYSIIPTREELNKKIINHYKYREIGFETIGRFIDELEIALNEIMPYYYQLYKSADVINGLDDIFGNVDIVETFREMTTGNIKDNVTDTLKGNITGSSNSSATSNTESNTSMNDKSRSVKSTSPQGNINVSDISGITHADEIGWNESSSNSNSESNGSDTTNSESSTTSNSESTKISNQDTRNTIERTYQKQGNQGVNTYAHDMKEFRELVLNIEQMIIKDKRINELFMLVY